jgi:hypothetical protein
MPRKKTIQPLPIETIPLDEGIVIEIRDAATREIGRGKDKEFYAKEFQLNTLDKLVDKILTLSPSKAKNILNILEGERTASKLSRQMQLDGADQEERALWEHAKGVQKEWQILMSALKNADSAETEEIKTKLSKIRSA